MNNYPKYSERNIVILDGEWDFKWLGDGNWEEIAPEKLTYDDNMPVPGVFDTTEKYAGKRGIAVYRKAFSFDAQTKRLKLKIKGMGLLGKSGLTNNLSPNIIFLIRVWNMIFLLLQQENMKWSLPSTIVLTLKECRFFCRIMIFMPMVEFIGV